MNKNSRRISMVQKFLGISTGTLVQKIARWKKAAMSAAVPQPHRHFLNDWQQPQQPEQLI